MSKGNKRTWKLQEIQAHEGSTNCLSIGHRSGKVMVTGGDDKKVNLWALGKSFCIMSLKGHTSGVDSVRFNGCEDTVVAGSQSGAVKIWNLEASKILRTLSGHKSNVKALDFHPFGDILASASSDTNIKLWDYRRKGCIFTYKGHTGGVNCLRFSPDGKWIASAGDDGCSRLWDMTTGKQIGEFKHPSGIVTSLTFHPVDFLMATAGSDRTVKFWDLDTFDLISSTDGDSAPIRNVFIHPEGWGAYAACQDYLKVYGWEPAMCYDSVNVGWGKPADIVVYQNQLIGASIQQNNVQIYMADLTKINHSLVDASMVQDQTSNPFLLHPSRRRSFLTKSPPQKRMEGGGEERGCRKNTGAAEVPEMAEYSDVFNPKHELPRDFEKRPSTPMSSPEERTHLKQRQSSPNIITDSRLALGHQRSNSQQNKQVQQQASKQQPKQQQQQPKQQQQQPKQQQQQRQTFDSTKSKRLHPQQRTRDSPRSKTTTASHFKQPTAPTSTTNTAAINHLNDLSIKAPDFPILNQADCIPASSLLPPAHHMQPFDPYIPMDAPSHVAWTGSYDATLRPPLHVNLQHFAPCNQADELSDEKSISCISGGHIVILNVFSNRHRNLQVFKSLWVAGNVKMALDSAVNMNDQSVLQDIINLLLQTPSTWTLDICTCILPVLSSLILSRYEAYATTGLNAVKFILRTFSSVIKDSLSNVARIGVDITQEERYNKSKRCFQMLRDIESRIDGRFCPSSITAAQEVHVREIKLLLAQMD